MGERDGREREVATWEKSNEANGSGGGGAWGGQGRQGARAGPGWTGPGWARLGCVTSRIETHDTHDH
jgi:hypothetical protein